MGWCNQTRAANVAKDQLLGEDQFANLQRQVQLDDAIVVQSHLVALRAWDKLKEPGNRSVSFPKTIQGQGEAYTHVL